MPVCHDNEHQRKLEATGGDSEIAASPGSAKHSPFANLKSLLDGKKPS